MQMVIRAILASVALLLAACEGHDLLPSPDSPEQFQAVTSQSSEVIQEQQPSSGTSGSSQPPAAGKLTLQEAENIALEHAGLQAAQAAQMKTEQDYEKGILVYEVEFWNGDTEYDYIIEASSGTILKEEQELHWAEDAPGGKEIGEQAAQNAALAHAGLLDQNGDPLYGMEWSTVQLEYDDGRPEAYEVKFVANGSYYKYEIGYSSGTVYGFKREVSPSAPASPSSGSSSVGDIGSAAAKAAALQHAGLSESQVTKLKVKQDREDGRLEYEVEFISGRLEYEYTIDGATGNILEYGTERAD